MAKAVAVQWYGGGGHELQREEINLKDALYSKVNEKRHIGRLKGKWGKQAKLLFAKLVDKRK